MEGAGLTHGAFYNYFKNKNALYVEALRCFFTDPTWKNRWKGIDISPDSGDVGAQVIRAYLSRQHFKDVANSCPMVALPTDVRRCSSHVKRAFENVFQAMVGTLEQSMGDGSRDKRRKAQAIAALSIGGLIVARALLDNDSADELREACMSVALELGGWE